MLNRHWYSFLLTAFLLTGCAAEISGSSTRVPSFDDFAAWFPGEYVSVPASGGVAAQLRLHVVRANLPEFGPTAFYAEWQAVSDPTDIVRQRVYALTPERGRLRLSLHILAAESQAARRVRGGHRNPLLLEGLSQSDMVPLAGCDIFFDAEGQAFRGAMTKQTCAFDAPDSGVPIYSWTQMRLSGAEFSYLDGWFHPDGAVYRQLMDDWIVFRRAVDG